MIYKNNNYKNSIGWGIRIYRREYPFHNPTKKFEALLIKLGKRGIWIFRNNEVYEKWPIAS